MANHLLLVEDEHDLRDLLTYLFETNGYRVTAVRTGEEAVEACERESPDILVLDVALPGMSGLEVCARLRTPHLPVLMLSSLDKDDQVVAGLRVGADDYVRKPFNHKELLLRVEKLLGRGTAGSHELGAEQSRVLAFGALRIDLDRGEVHRGGKLLSLTPTETKLLRVLAERIGYPVTNEELLKRVWDSGDWTGGDDLIKVNIRRLRKKIEEDPKHPRILVNRWGRGYLLQRPEE